MENRGKPINAIDGRLGEYGRGLTKREYFAGLAMQGLTSTETFPLDKVAEESVRLADELLKELEK